MKIAFLWHWRKKVNKELTGLAIKDSIINAIGKFSDDYDVYVYALDNLNAERETFCKEHNITYKFFQTKDKLIRAIKDFNPEVLMFNHHPKNYKSVRKSLRPYSKINGIYITSQIKFMWDWRKFDFIFANHEYQKKRLIRFGAKKENIWISPKTADEKIFFPMKKDKKWDLIYPARGGIGYLKRIELVIEAAKINKQSVVLPGSSTKLNKYPNVTVLPWLSPEELAEVYNKSRCLVITSNKREMGPRVIPEAVMCNLPFVVCSDSPAGVSYAKQLDGVITMPRPKDIAKGINIAINRNNNYREKALSIGLDVDINYRHMLEVINKYENKLKY